MQTTKAEQIRRLQGRIAELEAVPPKPAATVCEFRQDAARQVLRGLRLAGAEVVNRQRSPHGSDCSCAPDHITGPMGQCRCVRVLRLRVPRGGDWLLLFGDCTEGPTVRLQGPYTQDKPLTYGCGFWVASTV